MTLRLPPRREVAWAPPPHIFCELPRRRRPGRDAPPASGGGSGCKAAAGAPVGRRSGCGGAHDAWNAMGQGGHGQARDGPEQGVVVHRHAQQCSIRRRFPLHCT
ncbi:unnamed protein product [Prorocentrum cordatum]|uniref:Uncharacterized protein n=1 Tax=Prorocentrum cordatum TaxID=2364126 RepID=A0ABN9SLZ7_9DINO|nr:unnamed protein product [Polarella glacialis]